MDVAKQISSPAVDLELSFTPLLSIEKPRVLLYVNPI